MFQSTSHSLYAEVGLHYGVTLDTMEQLHSVVQVRLWFSLAYAGFHATGVLRDAE